MASITLTGELNNFVPPPGFEPDDLFDVSGSDALSCDERDPEHNYFVEINEVDEGILDLDYLEMIGALGSEDDESDDEGDVEITSWAPAGQIMGARLFKDHEMARPKMETVEVRVRGRRQLLMVEVRVRGNNHPRRCRVFLAYKAGTLPKPAVRTGTLHLHR